MGVTPQQHKDFLEACENLAKVRTAFRNLKEQNLVSGNDNHVGDIGEYWVARYLERTNRNPVPAPTKTAPYDFTLGDGTKVSVKTMTSWAKYKRGTLVKIPASTRWELAAVFLDDNLMLKKLAVIPCDKLRQQPPFLGDAVADNPLNSRLLTPYFRWWDFLKDYEVSIDWVRLFK
ncbi:MAG: hypothetical protein HY261_09325 [Chloroflexi bacterium]|nr:hypothetical protein [Chloroflexota bacterium]